MCDLISLVQTTQIFLLNKPDVSAHICGVLTVWCDVRKICSVYKSLLIFLLPQAFCRHCNSDAPQLKASSFSALTLCTVSLLAPFHTHSLSFLLKTWILIISALHCACRATQVFSHSFSFWRRRGLRSLECPWRSEWKLTIRAHTKLKNKHTLGNKLFHIVYF
jgi:hypothetical protein